MRIELWADPVCGWAYIARRRLATALAEWDGEPVELVWRPFRIDPTAPDPAVSAPTDEDAFGIARVAAAEGLGPRWGAAWRGDTEAAHRLLVLAFDKGGPELQDALAERLMRAHHIEARNITDRETLTALAAEAGLDDAGELLDGDAARTTLREEMLRGKAIGVTSSPTFAVGERLLRGAQTPGEILDFLRDSNDAVALPEEVRRLRHAEALLGLNDPLGALVLLRPLLDDFGRDPNVRMLAARAYFASAQLRRAEEILSELVEANPGDFYARYMLGRTLRRMGRADEAAPHLALTAEMFG
ncbi:DsbA family oxidoreductase [Phytomonospora sp. NPDC050363]|uniref:DsbA family oxidoreductase n=1 Tax=Phytomonospora sp. NPDC050363 TaxID=3155642 RepID=UPI0033E4C770